MIVHYLQLAISTNCDKLSDSRKSEVETITIMFLQHGVILLALTFFVKFLVFTYYFLKRHFFKVLTKKKKMIF